MAKKEMRTEPRLMRGRKATVALGESASPCVIQDFSTKGFMVMATKKFSVGDVVELRTELYPGQILECKVEVRHVSDDNCLGTRIVEISEAAARLCQHFMEEHYADRLKYEGR